MPFAGRLSAAGRPVFLQLSYYAVHSDIVYREKRSPKFKAGQLVIGIATLGYAAMLKELDDGIGSFLDVFDELQLPGNTYLFFTSDNGGMATIPPKRKMGAPIVRCLNHPLRRGKWDLTEGGVRVPFVVTGPGVEPGSQCNAPVVGYDLLPTFVELAGNQAKLPNDLDGASLAHLLRDPSQSKVERPLGDTIAFHMPNYNHAGLGEPHSAIREGRFKLLKFHLSERSLLFDL